MNDGIMSPPYPSETTNSRMLYRHIAAMRAWVVEQQEVLRPLVPAKFTESLVEPPTMESVTFWDNVSIIDKHTVLMWIRKIRETWDILLRQHEDAWDTKFALFQRYSVVHSAMMVLTQAFVGRESSLGEGVAQGREGLLGHAARLAAMASARRRAAMRLSARAMPLPAISKAVPWSGEVRTIGRPRVTFTPPQKSSILAGMRAWS